MKHLPLIPGITKQTKKHLKWKSLKYLLQNDERHVIRRYFFKRPVKYGFSLLKSCLKKKSFIRDDDFFLYGIQNVEEFKKLRSPPIPFSSSDFPTATTFRLPFRPFHRRVHPRPENPVCNGCFISKAVNAMPKDNAIPLFIPTIHYIGEKIFECVHNNPDKQILFLITACELTL